MSICLTVPISAKIEGLIVAVGGLGVIIVSIDLYMTAMETYGYSAAIKICSYLILLACLLIGMLALSVGGLSCINGKPLLDNFDKISLKKGGE